MIVATFVLTLYAIVATSLAIRLYLKESKSVTTDLKTDRTFTEYLALGETKVKAEDTLSLQISSPIRFKPRRLVLDPACASSLSILQMSVGKWSLIINGQPLPGTLFLPGIDDVFDFEPLVINDGGSITLLVRNRTKEEIVIMGTFVGPVDD